MENIILIDKEVGWTSNDVVTVLKKKLNPEPKKKLGQNEKKFMIGHAGTLDPFATGLLIVLVNDATKKFAEFQKGDMKKEYIVEIEFGKKTDTQDVTGQVVWEYDEVQNDKINLKKLSQDKLFSVLEKFRGKIWQVPPLFSAIKIDGKRAYDLARKNKNEDLVANGFPKLMEKKKREVEVYEWEILEVQEKILKVRFVVSSGTYIRTLANDIGEELGYGAFAKSLRRTKVGEYDVKNASKCDKISRV
jgi:tRNA pseudouridine55 synthase